MSVEKEIHALFIKKKWTLALAESCTGGAVSALLVSVPGASDYFLGSIVAYSNQAKKDLLDVHEEDLLRHGAVSNEVVQQMARGALDRFKTYIALAVTGIAGPDGGSKEKPVGTVFFAIALKDEKITVWKENFSGTRENIIKNSTEHALQRLFKFVKSL